MATWHGYFGIEDLNLTAPQRATLIAELRAMGPASDPQPARLNHWKTRLDNLAAIFEAAFDEDNLTIEKFKQRLGAIFNVNPASILHDTTQQSYSPGRTTPIVTFTHAGQDKIRIALFAGTGATWLDSQAEALGFIAANLEAWEPNLE